MAKYIYHERQVGNLCGVHCLNSLLQGEYFSQTALTKIGLELDKIERQLITDPSSCDESGWGNTENDGMFSIQVLSKALEKMNLQVVPLENPAVRHLRNDPTMAEAFVCHLDNHWFSMRRLRKSEPFVGSSSRLVSCDKATPETASNGSSASEDIFQWWDLNSTLPAPKLISHFYLSLYFESLRTSGYTIFVVQGVMPSISAPNSAQGSWISKDEAIAITESAKQAREAAKRRQEGGGSGGNGATPENSNVIPFSGTKHSLRDSSSSATGDSLASKKRSVSSEDVTGEVVDPNLDPELATAIAASLECERARRVTVTNTAKVSLKDEPDLEDPESISLTFRVSWSKSSIQRRFRKSDPVVQLFHFVETQIPDGSSAFKIFRQYPRKEIARESDSPTEGSSSLINSIGFGLREVLIVEELKS
mmetsp:Transcript_19327/g.34900  ORF Transcript_19327/g.34900 Transcript_19327/m.34900 type:complete len:421 (-) Transcript_19327:961-2223(-)